MQNKKVCYLCNPKRNEGFDGKKEKAERLDNKGSEAISELTKQEDLNQATEERYRKEKRERLRKVL